MRVDERPYQRPAQFEEGFTARTMLGVLFIALVMVPGSLYLNLVAGASLGGAAEWVTIILFVEVARRSFTTLKRQEIYLLYYVAAALIVSESGSFGPLWSQYLVQSSAARDMGLAQDIPHWVSPPASSEAIQTRTLLHVDWLPALGLLVVGMVLSRVSWISLSYFLFRITSDVERLPFPLAPIAAEGATALAETSAGRESWRWRVFSIGAVVGILFGGVYVGVPALTGALFNHPVQLLPIPWVDLTQSTEQLLPATAIGFTVSLGVVIAGFVLPYWIVIGTCVGALSIIAINPLLHRYGFLPTWHPGMDTIQVMFSNNVDFWLSFGMGTTFAVALVGIVQTIRALRRSGVWGGGKVLEPPKGRGDFPMTFALGAFAIVTACYIMLCRYLVPGFPWLFFVFFGFVFTPLNSYINARMIGISGQFTGIPFIAEGTYILSGYKGAAIWFAPVPLQNYGGLAQRWREVELTGTKFTSLIKAEAFMLPVILCSSIIFWSLLWRLGPIPSPAYPFAQKMWHLQALNQCLWISGTHSQGTAVIADDAFYLFERDAWERAETDLAPGEAPTAVLRDPAGTVWIGTTQRLFNRRRGGECTTFPLGPEAANAAVIDLAFDARGRLLVASDRGLFRREGERFAQLLDRAVDRVVPGADDDVWCLAGPELLHLDAAGARTVRGGLAGASLAVDRSGTLWVGTAEGLWSFDGWEWTRRDGPDAPFAPPVTAVATDPAGQAFVAAAAGIFRLEESWQPIAVPEAVERATVRSVDTVGDELWLVTDGGLYRQLDGVWENLSDAPEAPDRPVRAVDAARSRRWLLEAIKPGIVGSGLAIGLMLITGMSWLGLPVAAVYGFIRSLGSIPHMVLPEIIGALLGRYYFARKFGPENWRRYTPVLAAGFACGMGLIGMAAIAFVLAAKSVIASPF